MERQKYWVESELKQQLVSDSRKFRLNFINFSWNEKRKTRIARIGRASEGV